MESLLRFLEPLTRLISTAALIVLFFLFIVRPLLKYLIVNREIEHRKKLIEERYSADSPPPYGGTDDNNGIGDEEKIAADTVGQRTRTSDKDALNRLASGDPDKAGELVKKWVNSE